MTELFREEVYKKHTNQKYGTIFLSTPISNKVITAFLSVMFLGVTLFIYFGEFAKKERVRGYLTPNKGLISVVPQKAGVIIESYVQAGDDIKLGQNLFLVKVDTTAGTGIETARNLSESFLVEKQELQRLLDLVSDKYKVTEIQLKSRIAASEAEVEQLNRQVTLQETTVENHKKLLDSFIGLLEQEAGSSLEVFSQESNYIEASKELGAMKLQLQRSLAQTEENQSRLLLLPIEKEEEVRNLSNLLNSADQRITQAQAEQNYYITAPISGRLATSSANLGLAVNSQRRIVDIIPENDFLVAKLLVPSRAAGFVQEDQAVRLLYDAFPYQKFGYHLGKITSVSTSVIDNSQLPIQIGIREPVFIVDVHLEEQSLNALSNKYDLQSGMAVSADIVLEERKIWEWILEPILKGRSE